MSEGLRSCPFCGGEATVNLREDTWVIECKNHWWEKTDDPNIEVAGDVAICSCVLDKKIVNNRAKRVYSQEDIEKARKSAIDAWNRRAERTCRVEVERRKLSQTQTAVVKTCSGCGFEFGVEKENTLPFEVTLNVVVPPNYCPHCGARVIEEES